MTPTQEQFARVVRYLKRLERKGATDDDRDDMFAFFLNCWHLCDWAGNDPALGRDTRTIQRDAKAFPSLASCELIANGTKHLVLTQPKRPTPYISHADVAAWDGAEDRPAEATYTFTFGGGGTEDALTLARQAVSDWRLLLARYGVAL